MEENGDKFSILNFEMLGRDIKIDFTKHLTKKDKELFRHIKPQKYNHISLLKFLEIYSLEDRDEVIKFLNNLMSKNITIFSKESNYFTTIAIIQSFYINNAMIYLIFSDELTSSFKKGSFFDRLGLRNILFLEEKFSYRLYQFIYNSKDENIYISIEKLRDILEIGETYKRFYDIEKNLLLPIFEDIKKNGDIEIKYQKVKDGEHKSAKILGVSIQKSYLSAEEKIGDTSEIIDRFILKLGKKIKNFSTIYNLLVKNLAEYGEEHIDEKIEYVLHNFRNEEVEESLIKILSSEKIEEKPDFVVKKQFKNLFELHSEVLKYIQRKNLIQLSSYMFLVKIYSLKDKDSVTLRDKNIVVKINYNKNMESIIEFYIQK